MTPAITSPAPTVATRCLGCELAISGHACADHTVPVTERATVTATKRPAVPLHEYLPHPGESDRFPAL